VSKTQYFSRPIRYLAGVTLYNDVINAKPAKRAKISANM